MSIVSRTLLATVVATTVAIAGCDSNDGTAEKAGKKIDEMVQSTQQAVKSTVESAKSTAEQGLEKPSKPWLTPRRLLPKPPRQ